ncbi:MAG: beta-carotene hydroxylase [Bacteroidia bacterium]|jgi:beta-carotene hydroxylase
MGSSPKNTEAGELEKAEAVKLFAHPGIDFPTILLAVAMWAGLVANFAWAAGVSEWTAWICLRHILVGTFFLNMSFTIWHEAAHGTVFRARAANDVLGALTAWPAMIPYFTVRRDHNLHHDFVNDPERDPDFWFLEGSIWSLPFRYPKGAKRAVEIVDRSGRPAWEVNLDRFLLVLVLVALGLGIWLASPLAVLFAWILPKGFAMWIHAWYVNVLPHRDLPAERFHDTRIYTQAWLVPLTICHSYHGLHHIWPTLPWHRYPRAFRLKRDFLESRGVPIFPRSKTS